MCPSPILPPPDRGIIIFSLRLQILEMASYPGAPVGATQYEREDEVRGQFIQHCKSRYKLPLRIAEILSNALINTLLIVNPRVFLDGSIVTDSMQVLPGYRYIKSAATQNSVVRYRYGVSLDKECAGRAFFITVRDKTGREYRAAREIFTGIYRSRRYRDAGAK